MPFSRTGVVLGFELIQVHCLCSQQLVDVVWSLGDILGIGVLVLVFGLIWEILRRATVRGFLT